MSRAHLLLPLLLALPLAGCLKDQKAQLTTCKAEAAATFPAPTPGQPFKAIQACMDKAGYKFIGWDDGVVCDMTAVIRGTPSATGADALCFEPKGWLALKMYRIEVPRRVQPAG